MSFKWACVNTGVHHREHLLTKICHPKHAQNFCSKGCHFGVAWKKILIECVQAHQGKLGLQIWITLQVNYFKLQVNMQIRGAYCEWWAKELEVHLKLAKNLKPLLELPQQLCYLCIDSSHCLVPLHVHFLDKENEQCHHRKVVSPTRTTSTCMHIWYVVVLCEQSLQPCNIMLRLFKCCVTPTIKARFCIHSEDWNSNTGLALFIKFSISSRK